MTTKEKIGEAVLGVVAVLAVAFIGLPLLYGVVKVFHHVWVAVLRDLNVL